MIKVNVCLIALLWAADVFAGFVPRPCPSGYGNITFGVDLCVSKVAEKNQEAAALSGLQANNFSYHLPNGTLIQPYSEVLTFVANIGWDSSTSYWGRSFFNGAIYITQAAFNENSQAVLMAVTVHEADHSRYGPHTCGDGADIDDNGPYGAEAYNGLMDYYYSTTMDVNQKYRGASLALNRAIYNMCSNTDAYNRVLNAYLYAQFP
jgi:hypothetical protein